jgi:methylase of polypeptide subunit release factors
MIDLIAYEGIDVRQAVCEKVLWCFRPTHLELIPLFQVAHELSNRVKSSKARVVDLCCGVGISTRALHNAFPEAETVLGIDTVSRTTICYFTGLYAADA